MIIKLMRRVMADLMEHAGAEFQHTSLLFINGYGIIPPPGSKSHPATVAFFRLIEPFLVSGNPLRDMSPADVQLSIL